MVIDALAYDAVIISACNEKLDQEKILTANSIKNSKKNFKPKTWYECNPLPKMKGFVSFGVKHMEYR